METTTRELSGCTVVAVKGRLDAEAAPRFESSCAALIGEGERRLVLDLGELSYISSAGLRAVLATAKRLKQAGSGLAVACLTPMVSEIFAIAGFDRLLQVSPTVEDAAKAV
jgi:anti-anti-sigma factor